VVAYKGTDHAHVRDELVCRVLKEKCISASVKALMVDKEELGEVWGTLDTCFNHPEKYIPRH
jgi:hypothetical protein